MASVLLAGARQWIEHGSGIIAGDLTGDYMIHGGEYHNGQGRPVAGDANISINLDGKMAAVMYRYMGKAAQLKAEYNCGDFERREKGQLACKRNKKTGVTYCQVHLDLVTGKADLILGC
jgi:hypothetical protein